MIIDPELKRPDWNPMSALYQLIDLRQALNSFLCLSFLLCIIIMVVPIHMDDIKSNSLIFVM